MAEEEIFQPDSPGSDSAPSESSQRSAPAQPSEEVKLAGTVHRWPLRRWATVLAVVLLLVLGGIYAWQTFFPSLAQRLHNAEASWRAGLLARRDRNWNQATARFAQAARTTETVITTLENAQNQRPLTEQEKRLLGQAYWLRARALFGIAAVQLESQAAEKQSSPPAGLPEADKEDVLELFMIPDAASRREALVCLYRASHYWPDNLPVLREALKHRMNEPFDNWNWQHLRQLADTVAAGNATDPNLLARAYFVLALYGYHQPEPSGDGFRLPPAENKQRSPMLESLQWLQKLESVEQPLRFRSVYLRAQVWQWLAESYRRQAPRDPAESEKYRGLLEHLLFDATTGLPGALGQRAEKTLAELSPMDIEGVFGLYRLALQNLGKTVSTADAEAQNRLRNLAESAVRLVQQASSFPPHRALHAWRALGESASVVRQIQTRFSVLPEWWQQAGEQIYQSAEKIATTFSDTIDVETCQELAYLAIQLALADQSKQQTQRRHWLQQAELWAKRARQQLDKVGLSPQLKEQQEKLERRLHALRISPR
jgi:hypothetical protein